jgi:hypothetical protein
MPSPLDTINDILMQRIIASRGGALPLKPAATMPPAAPNTLNSVNGAGLLGLGMAPSLYSSGQNGLPQAPAIPFNPGMTGVRN